MNETRLSNDERKLLLHLAREAIEAAVNDRPLPDIETESLPANLRELGAAFVTLTEDGELRGCIGALEAYQPLAEDVREHAAAAAQEDFRFYPVRPKEVAHIQIEISRLTQPKVLDYDSTEDLLRKLRPGVDGVILRDGLRRATFLPQVWEKLPDKEAFLSHLCAKMGVNENTWRKKKLTVLTYQVEEFHE
jgi:AmmeMemoRadiSam system protein A